MVGSKRVAMALVIGMVRATGRATMPILGVAACAALAGQAHADVKKVAPRTVVVAKDNSAMRCADGGHFYAVRMLKQGQVLRVDGEGGGWLRVEYPEGTRAYVKQDEATFDAATKSVKLTRGSKLMAANEGGAAPWWYLLDTDVPAGTMFNDVEPVKAGDGTVLGYLVAAPKQARGFVRAEQVRAASADEAAKVGGATAPATFAAKPVETVKADPKPLETAAKPVDPNPPTTPASGEIVEIKPADGVPTKTTTETTTVTMTNDRATPAPARPNLELTKRIDDMNVLRDMFDRAMQKAESESEIRTVVSEFNRKIDALPATGEDGKIRTALEQRRDALTFRMEVLETRVRLNAPDQLDEKMRSIRAAVEQANRQAVYTIVGRMLPSTVYDGKRGMALMYRIESVDISSTRTIGYVVPREGIDLLPTLGKVVGIIGDSRMDPALGLNIVAPTRVDELQVVGGRFEVVPTSSGSPTPNTTPPAPSLPAGPGAAAKPVDPKPTGQPLATPAPAEPGEINK